MRLILFLILFIPNCLIAQVTGQAFLNGKTDHSGIKISFLPVSPSGIKDSTYTDSSGSFLHTLPGGVYQIEYSKANYHSVSYDSGAHILISGVNFLNDVTLDSINPNIVYVQGFVDGIWTKQNTYVVVDQTQVTYGDSLIIQEGTTIKVDGPYLIYGRIQVRGTANEPVLFTSNKSIPDYGDWGGLVTDGNVENAIFEYCDSCVSAVVNNYNQKISNNEIRYFKYRGITGLADFCEIIDNNIHNFYSGEESVAIITRYYNSFGHWNTSNQQAVVECNNIFNGYGIGIQCGGSDYIQNNRIRNIQSTNSTSLSIGIRAIIDRGNKSVFLKNNLIVNCDIGSELRNTIGNHSTPGRIIFSNNIIRYGQFGISVPDYPADSVIILSNIIANNYVGILGNQNIQSIKIENNDFYLNEFLDYSNLQNIVGLGQIVSTNLNGTPCDPFLNIYLDPEFADTISYSLLPNSPCLNAGHPNTYLDIGLEQNFQCGNVPIPVNIDELYLQKQQVKIYPNPFNTNLTISFLDNYSSLEIIDLNGKVHMSQDVKTTNLNLELTSLESGIYILNLKDIYGQVYRERIIKE